MFVKSPAVLTVTPPLLRFFKLGLVLLGLALMYVCLVNLSYGYVTPWTELLVIVTIALALHWEQKIEVSSDGIKSRYCHGLICRLSIGSNYYPRASTSDIKVERKGFGYLAWYDSSVDNTPMFYSGSFLDNQL